MFLSDLCLWAKAYVLYAPGRGERVFVSVERDGVSVTRHASACVLFCDFLWVKSQDSTTTEPG